MTLLVLRSNGEFVWNIVHFGALAYVFTVGFNN